MGVVGVGVKNRSWENHMEQRVLSSAVSKKIGEKITIAGWVNSRRDHGKLVFIDLRDCDGLTQVVFIPGAKAYQSTKDLRPEFVVKITGQVEKRPEKMVNRKIASGAVEIRAEEMEILNPSLSPPFEISDTTGVNEEIRMTYRYLDLRSPRMTANLKNRSRINQFLRTHLINQDFVEVETPDLTKGTPEGAREYIVPCRQHPGQFYVLPQSPQQFKQLLMVAGLERYFQIARCFRDEDSRGDRQPEFTQLDLEMSFVSQEEVMEVTEKMITAMVKELFPEKKITLTPFPRLAYKEAIERYQTDKPDLRKDKSNDDELSFCWLVDFPLFEYSATEKKLVATHHLFTSPNPEDINLIDKQPKKVRAWQYDLVLNGYEIGSGSIRIHQRDLQEKIFQLLKITPAEIKRRFGHMLKAFEFGAPPHGGIALGLDRISAILAKEKSIREVIAFPKTGDGRDLLMDAPSELPEEQLKEVKIKTIAK
ncbi:MAG: aspartyl-tRNA synthetase [Candidatus Berkelbacteria bacterium Licking1014_2]|uniref:Aspartate--tRNA(Asp/Asn) ligase n=1 Tax=Candidatus Berkelbacteria bacterium Licking1014_2 TaxID=2017146 RepID=A0A554LWK3_9BACT|nr:MAG: aspartyl-tRNA synthetase [Candidatus Berkelbacteria bacterium Licking1014_2]